LKSKEINPINELNITKEKFLYGIATLPVISMIYTLLKRRLILQREEKVTLTQQQIKKIIKEEYKIEKHISTRHKKEKKIAKRWKSFDLIELN